MNDKSLDFADERGLGKVRRHVRLASGLTDFEPARLAATLLLTTSGLWLVAARDRFHGRALELLAQPNLRLESGRVRDRLCFGGEALQIPTGRRHAVERLFALARMASPAPERAFVQASRFIEELDELALACLRRELWPAEVLLCFLRGDDSLVVPSPIIGDSECHPYLLVTEGRAVIVAWSRVGDVLHGDLESASSPFASQRRDAEAHRDALELRTIEPGLTRILETARRAWLTRNGAAHNNAFTRSLLQAAVERGSERARLALFLVRAEDEDEREKEKGERGGIRSPLLSVTAFTESPDGAETALAPEALAELWANWKFSANAGRSLLRALLDAGAEAHALALHHRLDGSPSADEACARDDLRLARFAIAARLTRVGETRQDAERDESVRALLAEGGLRIADRAPRRPQNPLSLSAIEDVLTHPLARGQGSLVPTLQKLVAHSPEPDHGALSDYCEALDGAAHPEARRALDAARLAFSLPALHAYVSRGKKSLGLRGYSHKGSPFVLVGKNHLDTGSPFHMSEAELFYAFGAEALHVKLGQARLTSSEVWAGAFARTKGGMELLLGLLPLLQGMPLGASASKLVERVPEAALRRGLAALLRFEHERRATINANAGPEAVLSHVNENLLAAHRLMQMSADRAGLLLCGDLRASLRALLLLRPDTFALLESMSERGLTEVLLDPAARDSALHADLTVRVAALLRFYTSDDFVTLRRALCGP